MRQNEHRAAGIDGRVAQQVADTMFALSTPSRVQILGCLLDGPHAGAPVKVEGPGGRFVARKLEAETLTVGPTSYACAKLSGEETAGKKTGEATRWWSASYPLGPVKSTGPNGETAFVAMGENWNKRPPFPS